MATKTISGSYPTGYNLNPSYSGLTVLPSAYLGGYGTRDQRPILGIATSSTNPTTITVLGTVNAYTGISLRGPGTITVGNAANPDALVEGLDPIIAVGPVTINNRATIETTWTYVNGKPQPYADPSVIMYDGGTVNNVAGAKITNGIYIGIGASDTPATVVNNGAIGGSDPGKGSMVSVGVVNGPGTVINGSGGNTTAYIGNSVYFLRGQGSVTNNGTIASFQSGSGGNRTVFEAIHLDDGGRVTNGSASNHSAAVNGIVGKGAYVLVSNNGIIGARAKYSSSTKNGHTYTSHQTLYSIALYDGGTITNGSAANSDATISNGIYFSAAAAGTVTNHGTIGYTATKRYQDGVQTYSGTGYSIDMAGGGTIVNGGATDNAATIGNGILLEGAAGTITNFGTIDGTSKDAVNLAGGGTLIEEGSGTLAGNVSGGGGSTLELGNRGGAGTLTGLGDTIADFAAVKIDPRAAWTLSSALVAAGTTLTDSGVLTIVGGVTNDGEIDLAGNVTAATTDNSILSNADLLQKNMNGTGTVAMALDNGGTVEVATGVLDLQGAVTGTGGTLQIDAGQRLQIDASVAATQTVSFVGTGDRLTLTDAPDFAAPLSGFAAGDQLVLTQFDANSTLGFAENDSNTGGTLTVTDGALQATVALLGQYAAAGFHMGATAAGEILTYNAPATQAHVTDHLAPSV